MGQYFIGLDIGTQSAKAILVDADSRQVIAQASMALQLIPELPPSYKEQNPVDWIEAANHAIEQILRSSEIDRRHVRGIGVSGQQHGFVPLDKDDNVIRP